VKAGIFLSPAGAQDFLNSNGFLKNSGEEVSRSASITPQTYFLFSPLLFPNHSREFRGFYPLNTVDP